MLLPLDSNHFSSNHTISISFQWDLVCDVSALSSLTKSVLFLGFLIGVLLGGVLSDKFGRRKLVYLPCSMCNLLALLASFVQAYWLYVLLRVLVGVCIGELRPFSNSVAGSNLLQTLPHLPNFYTSFQTNRRKTLCARRIHLVLNIAAECCHQQYFHGCQCAEFQTALPSRWNLFSFAGSVILLCALQQLSVKPVRASFLSLISMWLEITFPLLIKTFPLPTGCGTLSAYVLTVEYVGKRHRHVAGTALWFFWPTSLMMMALMAYLIRDWRNLNIVGAAPGLFQIFLWW